MLRAAFIPITTTAIALFTTSLYGSLLAAEPNPPSPPSPAPTPPAQPAPTPQVQPAPAQQPAAKDAPPAGNSSLSNLVAEAIKRKLEHAAANKPTSAIELPPVKATPAEPTPQAPTLPNAMPIMGAISTPDPTMISGGATLMMGAPTDGSPAYVRVAPGAKSPAAKPNAAPAVAEAPVPAQANPFARPTDPMEAGTEPAAAASEPGSSHNLLDIFVGTWDVTANFDTGPGQPPETANGTMVNSWQLDGRWLKQEYSGQMASLGSFRGLGYLGYDNLQKMYVGTWMDTLSTSCIMSRGAYDQKASTFTLTGDFSAPGGERYKQKQVMTVLNPDRYVVTMFLTGPDGAEFKTGNLEYTRSVKKVTGVSTK